jgi:large subunit ribosomal protein L15e
MLEIFRCWGYRQLNIIHRASHPSRPNKAYQFGYKAKQGYVVYRIRVRRDHKHLLALPGRNTTRSLRRYG